MNSIILCEGRVDAALIGQYLASQKGWQYSKNKDKPGSYPQTEDKKQIINRYKRDDHWVYLWGVGGRTRFSIPIRKIMELNTVDSATAYNNIIFVVDRDDEDEDVILTEFANHIGMQELRCNEWLDISYQDQFGKDGTARIMILIIPVDEKGALETVLINSLAENDDEAIIPQCYAFIEGIKTKKYLQKRREILKAKLSVIISIVEPDRAADSLVEIVEGIQWTKFHSVNRVFNKLLEL